MNLSDDSKDVAMVNINTSQKEAPVETEPETNQKGFFNLTVDSTGSEETPLSLDSLAQTNDEKAGNFFEKIWEFRNFHLQNKRTPDSLALKSLGYEVSFWNSFLYHQAAKSNNMQQEEFNNFFYKNVFWILFLFVPVLGLWLKVFYWRQSFYYPEHLFFAFFNQSVLFLLFSLGFVFQLNDQGFAVILMLYAVYLFWAMRVFYQQRYLKTLFKFLALNVLVIFSFAVFILSSIIVTYLIF